MSVERHLTTLDLDRLQLGEITGADRRGIEAHAARCLACAAKLAEHTELATRFRDAVFARSSTTLAVRRRARGARAPWALWLAVPALAASVLVSRGFEARRPARGDEPVIGVKGDDLWQVFARRAGAFGTAPSVVRVSDGARLAPGDALRFVLSPTGLSNVLIASVDGAGQVNVYYPFGGESSAPINGHTALAVPGSIVLDRAPGPERLFALFSATPLEARVVRSVLARTATGGPSAVRAAGRLAIPGTVQATLLFEKEETP